MKLNTKITHKIQLYFYTLKNINKKQEWATQKERKPKAGVVAHTYRPRYSGDWGWRNASSRPKNETEKKEDEKKEKRKRKRKRGRGEAKGGGEIQTINQERIPNA